MRDVMKQQNEPNNVAYSAQICIFELNRLHLSAQAMAKKYNWQHPSWPDFTYDQKLTTEIAAKFMSEYRELLNDISLLPADIKESIQLEILVDEATNTSAIEGITTNRDSLRASIASKLFIPEQTAKQDPYSTAVTEVITELRNMRHSGIDHDTLWRLQHDLVQSQSNNFSKRDIGYGYRTFSDDMVIADAQYQATGKGEIFFVAPPSASVPRMMVQFIKQFNATHPQHIENEGDNFARIAKSHIWFESIHPFEDGNGRIGRAISDLALCQLLGHDAVIGISQQLSKNNKEYNSQLEAASSNTIDISDWIEWFGKSLIQSTISAQENISLAKVQSEWWNAHKHLNLNDRHKKVIRRLFQFGSHGMEGGMTARKYMGITRTSKATATRDLAYLDQIGVIKKNEPGGRSTNYRLTVFDSDAIESKKHT